MILYRGYIMAHTEAFTEDLSFGLNREKIAVAHTGFACLKRSC